ncbi:MAG: hypothetical protein Q7S02_06745, partial [bacterium]|nr:hypothetical protein [bacterium]
GGGSGGTASSGGTILTMCSQDEWSCAEWNPCSLSGQQTRACTKTVDCRDVEAPPSPPTVRTCTPTCSTDDWTCGSWGSCVGGRQNRFCTKTADCPVVETPSPATESACRLSCGADIWTCTSWSACSSASTRTRKCTQRPDCELPDVPAPKPREQERCTPTTRAPRPVTISPLPAGRGKVNAPAPKLVCGNLTTLAERVTCRLGLSEEALDRELETQYFPEECRASPEGRKRTSCVERYRNLRPCWAKPIGAERLACVREVLGIRDLQTERKTCDTMPAETDPRSDFQLSPRTECLFFLRERAHPYVTFRFYDLEERAEGLKEFGTPIDLVATFVTTAEQGKIDFNAASSKDERIAIIRRVQSAWRAFVAQLPASVIDRVRKEGIGSSY